MVDKAKDIKFEITARDSAGKIIYGSTVLDTASIDTVLALNDELFSDYTRFQIKGFVDGKEAYNSNSSVERKDIDSNLEMADEVIAGALK